MNRTRRRRRRGLRWGFRSDCVAASELLNLPQISTQRTRSAWAQTSGCCAINSGHSLTHSVDLVFQFLILWFDRQTIELEIRLSRIESISDSVISRPLPPDYPSLDQAFLQIVLLNPLIKCSASLTCDLPMTLMPVASVLRTTSRQWPGSMWIIWFLIGFSIQNRKTSVTCRFISSCPLLFMFSQLIPNPNFTLDI